ncbi:MULTISPECIES: hypothetical protein [Rhizobium]|uniref:hypothetical protein n=1 Tax=Rhizobium TaxID=379 RepID=UPI001EF79EDF|nr:MULTISPECIES: hypothetical protein [Rhizobium]ULJ81663.1 hypothetical protein MF410_26895 [Rhizobium sp. C104]
MIIFLHGIGASGAQLTPLASSWRARLPGTRFVAPDAPMHHRYGRRWFSTEGNPLDPERIKAPEKHSTNLSMASFGAKGARTPMIGSPSSASRREPSSRSTPLLPGGERSAHWSRSPACLPRSRFRPRATARRCFWCMERTTPPSLPWLPGSRPRSSE